MKGKDSFEEECMLGVLVSVNETEKWCKIEIKTVIENVSTILKLVIDRKPTFMLFKEPPPSAHKKDKHNHRLLWLSRD